MSKFPLFLSLIWALSLLYGEWLAFLVPSLWTCSWPHLHRPSLDGSNQTHSYVKIAVIADPQIMDRTSLPLHPKSLALETAQFYTDLNMRRAVLSSILPFNPDVILFLGDYFDGGVILSYEEWQDSLNRFKHIFNLNMLQQVSDIKIYYLSGNHDIGYSAINHQMPELIQRYEREFGARNFKVTLGKVEFVAIDAQTLDGNLQGNLTPDTWNFIRNVSKGIDSTPRVLLTHIPLYRPDWSSCGSYRSSPIINQRVQLAHRSQEILYQNYITKNSSDDLIDLIRPSLILSGHDHDQCTVTHSYKHGSVNEHTLGTVSWQQGNLYPSFMLLSASNSTLSPGMTPDEAILTHLCFLPMQTHIYLWYLFLFIMTVLFSLLGPANEVLISNKLRALIVSIRKLFDLSSFMDSVKEKNDEEITEYEEMWDAEGSMHLIKKTSKAPIRSPINKNSTERGSAIMRSAAKKPMTPESDVSINVGIDVKVPPRTQRSKVRIVIWRLFRALRTLSVVAAINIPLYVLLVFKDWIDK